MLTVIAILAVLVVVIAALCVLIVVDPNPPVTAPALRRKASKPEYVGRHRWLDRQEVSLAA